MPSYDKKSRREIFDEVDHPAARSLADHSWEYQPWLRRRVGIDYCVELDNYWYSVPYALVGRTVEVRATVGAREVYLDQACVDLSIDPAGTPCQAIWRRYCGVPGTSDLP